MLFVKLPNHLDVKRFNQNYLQVEHSL